MSAPSRGNIVILTGAGISAESGLGTFRDKGGIWEKFDWQKLATPEAFAADPHSVHAFYNARRDNLLVAEPNDAHRALAAFETLWEGEERGSFLLVTQNIDNLHARGGSREVLHMHGELLKSRCNFCGHLFEHEHPVTVSTPCPGCGKKGGLRPHVVWFGEMPLGLDTIYEAIVACDLFIAIGTSGTVYPVAGFVAEARAAGAWTVELSLEPGEVSTLFDERHYGPATKLVPEWLGRF